MIVHFTVGTKGIEVNFDEWSIPDSTRVMRKAQRNIAATKDVSLLATCSESRAQALLAFKNTLPVANGIIRFNDDTLIFIENLTDSDPEDPSLPSGLSFNNCLRLAICLANRKMPSYLSSVRRLATFPPDSYKIESLLPFSRTLFPQLESVRFSGKNLAALPPSRNRFADTTDQSLRVEKS